MIDVTKGTNFIIEIGEDEIFTLKEILRDYLADKDANERAGGYEDMQELYDKLKSAQ